MSMFKVVETGRWFWSKSKKGLYQKVSDSDAFDGNRTVYFSGGDEVDEEWWFYIEKPTMLQIIQGIKDGATVLEDERVLYSVSKWDLEKTYTFASRMEEEEVDTHGDNSSMPFSELDVGERFWDNGLCLKVSDEFRFDFNKNRMRNTTSFKIVDMSWWKYIDNPSPLQFLQGIEDGALVLCDGKKVEELEQWDTTQNDYEFAEKNEWRDVTEKDVGNMVFFEIDEIEVKLLHFRNDFNCVCIDKMEKIKTIHMSHLKVRV